MQKAKESIAKLKKQCAITRGQTLPQTKNSNETSWITKDAERKLLGALVEFHDKRVERSKSTLVKLEQESQKEKKTFQIRYQLIETLSNSRRCHRSGWPEVKMHYWCLLRMRKTKLQSSFSCGRLATCVSEVVFGRWVFIHFFCLLSNMPWKHNHISVSVRIFWNQRYLSESSWRNWSLLLIEELSPLL